MSIIFFGKLPEKSSIKIIMIKDQKAFRDYFIQNAAPLKYRYAVATLLHAVS